MGVAESELSVVSIDVCDLEEFDFLSQVYLVNIFVAFVIDCSVFLMLMIARFVWNQIFDARGNENLESEANSLVF